MIGQLTFDHLEPAVGLSHCGGCCPDDCPGTGTERRSLSSPHSACLRFAFNPTSSPIQSRSKAPSLPNRIAQLSSKTPSESSSPAPNPQRIKRPPIVAAMSEAENSTSLEENPPDAEMAEVTEGVEGASAELPFAEAEPEEPARQSFASFLMSPVVTLRVGGQEELREVSAHQALLERSPFFKEACAAFAEGGEVRFLLSILSA